MGTFVGHVIPGTFFLVFALVWVAQASRRYFASTRAGSRAGGPSSRYYSMPTFSFYAGIDLESLAIAIVCGIGILIELGFANTFRGRSFGVSNLQHSTMYLCFGVSGLAGVFEKRLRKYVQDVRQFRYALFAISFVIEGLLFQFHVFGKDAVNIQVHTLLVYSIYACALATCLEASCGEQVLATYARCLCVFVQGSWFWNVAFILYNPVPNSAGWNPENHHHRMLITCIFAWHVIAGAVLAFLVVVAVGSLYPLSETISSLPLTQNGKLEGMDEMSDVEL